MVALRERWRHLPGAGNERGGPGHSARARGLLYEAAARVFTLRSPLGRQRLTTIDVKGKPVQEQTGILSAMILSYDAQGRLSTLAQGSGTDERRVSFSYDSRGWLSSVTDPLSRTVAFEYDVAGRVIKQTLPDDRFVLFSYDENGNLTSVTPPGRAPHLFRYSLVDQAEQYQPPAVGAGIEATDYSHDLDRKTTLVRRPDGRNLSLNYDGAGRLSELLFSEGALTYGYSSATGNLETITAPGFVALRREYDGSLPTRTTWTGPVAGSVGSTYDDNFRVVARTVNGSQPIGSSFDQDGLLTKVGDLTIGRSSENGLVTGAQIGQITTGQSYNAFGEMIATFASYAGIPMLSSEYTRDKLGRITRRVETLAGATSTHDYSYDAAGRLTDVVKDGEQLSHYEYDANSNRTSVTTPASALTADYDAQDRLLRHGDFTYTYSENGDLETKSQGGATVNYLYDEFGNLRSVVLPDGITIDYVIDGRNRRIGKRINGTLVQGFLYESQLRVAAEMDGTGNVVSRFVFGTRSNVPEYMVRGGAVYRILTDHLGSPRLVVNVTDGWVAQRLDFDEWGSVTLDTNPGFQPFGFAGGLYDPQTGLLRFGARDYSPGVGVWTSKDPLLFAGGSANMYEYSNGDPVNRRDLSGMAPGDRTFGLPADFWDWYHRQYKQDGDPDLDNRGDAEAVYDDWQEQGRPDSEGHRTVDDENEAGQPSEFCELDSQNELPELPELSEVSPCAVVGAFVGAAIGGTILGALGGAGGTFVVPGVGTVGGAVGGWSAGAAVGGAIVGGILGQLGCQ